MMTYLMAIDDTDMPDTRGTGHLVQELCGIIAENGWAVCSSISRHQLFVHDDVPYTSHNSAMCVEFRLSGCTEAVLTAYVQSFLEKYHAKGSDPGLCITRMPDRTAAAKLMDFGFRAKTAVLTKSQACALAAETGVSLSEHGGDGQGVIGALAGIGLRLTGNDGRYRGWYHFGRPGDVVSVGDLCAHDFIESVVTPDGTVLHPEETLCIGSYQTKTVRLGYRQVLVALPNLNGQFRTDIRYRTLTRQEAKQF